MNRILLVDDNEDNADLFRAALKSAGFTVDVARDGTTALEKYAAHSHTLEAYDLLILDLAMPFINGFEVKQRIRESGDHHTKIAYLTAHAESPGDLNGDDARLHEPDLCAVWHKPIEITDFLAAVAAVLRE